jgi:hypothetical protein
VHWKEQPWDPLLSDNGADCTRSVGDLFSTKFISWPTGLCSHGYEYSDELSVFCFVYFGRHVTTARCTCSEHGWEVPLEPARLFLTKRVSLQRFPYSKLLVGSIAPRVLCSWRYVVRFWRNQYHHLISPTSDASQDSTINNYKEGNAYLQSMESDQRKVFNHLKSDNMCTERPSYTKVKACRTIETNVECVDHVGLTMFCLESSTQFWGCSDQAQETVIQSTVPVKL